VVLLIASPVDDDQIQELIDQSGLSPLMKPSQLIHVDTIPKLGTGKDDFERAKQIAMGACA